MKNKANSQIPFPVAYNKLNHFQLPLLGKKKRKAHTKNPFKTKIYYIPDDTVMRVKCLDGFLMINVTNNDNPHEIIRANLSRLRIQSSKPEDFQYFLNLQDLDVSENQLQLEDLTSFPSLKILKISANNIKNIEITHKNTFEQLQHLDLSFNYLSKEAISSLKHITELKELYLVRNELLELPTDMSEFTKLELLDISDNAFQSNQTASILWEVLGQIPELKTLNISKNFLRGIHTERLVVGYFNKLETLDFSYNIAENQHNLICARNFTNLKKIIITGNPFGITKDHQGLEMEIHARTGGILINDEIEKSYLKKPKIKRPPCKFEQLKRVENDILKLPVIEQSKDGFLLQNEEEQSQIDENQEDNMFVTENQQIKQQQKEKIQEQYQLLNNNQKPQSYEEFKKLAQEILGDNKEYDQNQTSSGRPVLDLTKAYQQLKSVINKPEVVDYEDYKEPNYMKPTASIPRYKYQQVDDPEDESIQKRTDNNNIINSEENEDFNLELLQQAQNQPQIQQ
ncbi:unnamed protein product [Paramecium sonneborni]|uniref:Leucine rich repeat protein n=1 Tax=Paramecium sonneborni TaxID=65129 RepID=A0A8S1L5Q8_9CILI|nr:unnamed protein product [Paramecium sonneborni]